MNRYSFSFLISFLTQLHSLLLLIVYSSSFLNPTYALSALPNANSILIFLESSKDRLDYSHFFTSLENRGFHLLFEMVHEAPTLVQYQQLKARHVIDLASSTPLTHGRSPQRILEFIEAGGNWMFMVDTNVSTLHVNFLREFGWALRRATLPSASSMTPVEFSSRMAASLLQASSSSSSSSSSSTPIPALKLSSTPMVHTVLHPDSLPHLHTWAYLSPTYVHPSSSRTPTQTVLDETQAVQVRLVSSLIARNQARISLVGCTDLIHNRNFNPEDPSSATNRRFMQTLTQFTFHELGVFRISSVTTQHVHPIKANLSEPYRIKDWM
ncbi:oligosaccharyl transferase glycoprotein complex, beta subunit, partial [Coelomomyces lativittatus]